MELPVTVIRRPLGRTRSNGEPAQLVNCPLVLSFKRAALHAR